MFISMLINAKRAMSINEMGREGVEKNTPPLCIAALLIFSPEGNFQN